MSETEEKSGFAAETRCVSVHWRRASWQEISELCNMDDSVKPSYWNDEAHPWVLLVSETDTRFGWAYSRTTKEPKDDLTWVREKHFQHGHLTERCLLTKLGHLQIAPEERFAVPIKKFLALDPAPFHGIMNKCDRETHSFISRLTRQLALIHQSDWICPKLEDD